MKFTTATLFFLAAALLLRARTVAATDDVCSTMRSRISEDVTLQGDLVAHSAYSYDFFCNIAEDRTHAFVLLPGGTDATGGGEFYTIELCHVGSVSERDFDLSLVVYEHMLGKEKKVKKKLKSFTIFSRLHNSS